MKRITLLFALLILASCGVKTTRKLVASGDYDSAISKAVNGLQSNKNAKGKQDYVYLLEEAFAKAKERDLRDIAGWGWFKDANPNNLEAIFTTYQLLSERQEMIRPLLPLKLLNEKRDAIFPMEDYTEQLTNSKNALSKYLYINSVAALISNDKLRCRRAYDDLVYLNQINPGFKDVSKLIDEAQLKGTDYVIVSTKNQTNVIIPQRLNNDLLDFSTFGLNEKWTAYHSTKQKSMVYDYGIEINFRDINIAPERISEREFQKEKVIKDGVKKLLDARGREVKDSLGKPIYVDNMKTVQIAIYESTQQKAAQVTAKVDYVNLKTNQLLETFPLSSSFVFQNIFARYQGDRRACDADYLQNFDRRPVPFPTNEQLVFDCGEDLKAKLKAIISANPISN